MSHFRRYRNLTLKLFLALAAFYVVFSQTDIPTILRYIQATSPLALAVALFLSIAAQIVSAFRMRYYYQSAGQAMSRRFAIGLYFVGMLYNTILPGGIGGDGYKVYLMGKLAKFSYLTSFRLMVSNRASGLYLLFLYTILLAFFSKKLAIQLPYTDILLVLALITVTAGYFISVKLLLKEPFLVALKAIPYSALVQVACIVTGYALFLGMDRTEGHMVDYLMVFMVSSVVSVIPISIGGAGLREITFLYGSHYLGLNVELGIAFSIIYFVLTVVCSLCGLCFVTKLVKLWEKEQEHGRNADTGRGNRSESTQI